MDTPPIPSLTMTPTMHIRSTIRNGTSYLEKDEALQIKRGRALYTSKAVEHTRNPLAYLVPTLLR